MLRQAVFAAALFALGACATQETQSAANAPTGRDCFRSNDVFGYNLVDSHTVRVTIGPSRQYLLRTGWNAGDLNWDETIAIRSANGWICTGNGLGVEIIGGQPRQSYQVNGIERVQDAPAPTGS